MDAFGFGSSRSYFDSPCYREIPLTSVHVTTGNIYVHLPMLKLSRGLPEVLGRTGGLLLWLSVSDCSLATESLAAVAAKGCHKSKCHRSEENILSS